ncbi:MAG TPA: hypothetical protein VF158_02265, partial [Longimicrobiales bacterium]
MRTGWNPRLAALLQRPDPAARLIPEAVVTSAEDVRRRKEEWDAADNTPGWIALDSGGARLLGISSTLFDQSDRTVGQYITDLAPDGSWPLARFEWQGLGPATTIDAVDVWLHPRVDGGQPQTVAKWQLRLFGLVSYRTFQGVDIFILELAELMPPVMVDAGGAEGVVTFQLGAGVQPARFTPQFVASPGGDPAGAAQRYDRPTMFAAITALDAQGAAATNVGWAKLQGTNVVNDGGHELTGWTLERIDSGPDAGRWRDNSVDASDVPYIVLRNSTYNPAKISFTGANRIDLGAPPGPDEQVEIVAQGETPGGSELLFELLADDGVTWVPVRDGQTTDELAGVSARQTYEMRVTLAPDAAGDVTPIVRDLGVRTVRRWTLLGPAEVQVTGWAFDPVTLRGEIPQATIEIIRDGERDYRDFATELLSDSPAADIEFRLWIGADRLPRSDWLLIDTYELEDYDPQPDRIVCSCISPLARLRVAQLPVYDEVGGKREPLVYTNQPIADIYADLVGGQVALPERYRGPGPTSVELVGKTITGSDAKTELDRLSLVAGGAIICSQGVVKWRDIAGAAGVTAIFPAEEIQVVGATPGLRQAVPEYFVPFDYSADEDRFRGEVRSFHLPALEAVRAGRLDAPARLDDETARWISSEQLARAIGERHVGWFGTGLILLDFTSEYAHPYLEPGDLVLVELRSFVARDPVTARALRGQLWALAVLSEVRDAYGRRLTAWVRSYADLLSTSVALARIGDVRPEVLSVERIVDADGNVDVVAYGSPATGYLRAAASKTAFPDAATVDASPALAGRVVAFDDLIQLGEGELAYVSIRAYERSDGQGAKSDLLKIVAERPGFAGAIECRARIVDSTETTVTVQVDVVAPAGAPTVQLIALTGANVVSGPAQGVPSPAGTQWTLSRPAFQTGVGQAQFRAALNGRTDDDLVAIEEQGRDTVPLLVRASVVANSEGTMTVRVAVADPFPGGDITVQYTQLGTGGVTPASPQVIPGAAVTADIDTTGSID